MIADALAYAATHVELLRLVAVPLLALLVLGCVAYWYASMEDQS